MGREDLSFCQFFTHLFIPGGTPEQHRWWSEQQKLTASPDVAARLLDEMQGIDVLDRAAELRTPTLVFHCRGDMRVPFAEGLKLAAAIPGARFVPLDSRNHVLLPDEPDGQKRRLRFAQTEAILAKIKTILPLTAELP